MASLARETAAATRARHARLLALVLAAVAMFDRGARGPAGGQEGRGDAGRHQVPEGRGGSMGAARRSLVLVLAAVASGPARRPRSTGRRCPQESAPPPREVLRQERGQGAHRHRRRRQELRHGC